MKKLTTSIASILACSTLVFAGCNSQENKTTKGTNSDKLNVYTTLFSLEDFTKKIGGKHVEVTGIYPPGVDSHTYEPTTKMMVDIAKSDLFIYNGLEMEAFAEKMVKTLESEDVAILNASTKIEALEAEHNHESEEAHDHAHEGEEAHDHAHEGEEAHDHAHEGEEAHDHAHGDVDPHVWFDPALALVQAESIKNELVKLKPEAKNDFEQNFEKVKSDLQDLEKQLKDVVSNAKRKEILVSHAAYGYWENHYGIKQIPVAGISASQEPSQKELANIVKTAKDHNIQYILLETFSTPKVAEIVQKETGTKVLRLNHIATVTEDDRKEGKDYFTLMQENIDMLEKALNE